MKNYLLVLWYALLGRPIMTRIEASITPEQGIRIENINDVIVTKNTILRGRCKSQ
jgi:hypothetical protein